MAPSPGSLGLCPLGLPVDPSFDLRQTFDGVPADIVVGHQDHMDCLPLYGVSRNGKNFIAFLQETDDVVALGNWSCRISRRDFDAYGYDIATGRGLTLCAYRINDQHIEYAPIIRTA
jgi:hypothetical protein